MNDITVKQTFCGSWGYDRTGGGRQIPFSADHFTLALVIYSRVCRGDIYVKEGNRKIEMIKMFRNETGVGLLEAKTLIEHCEDIIVCLRDNKLVGLVNPIERPVY